MNTSLFKLSARLLLCAAVLSTLVSASFPSKVHAKKTYEIRFTAKWVEGSTSTKDVYYIVDDGSAHHLGTVAKGDSGDFSFDASFSDWIRVYVHLNSSTVYHEHLYVNDNSVESGDVGNEGLTYYVEGKDETAPTGRITSPVSGSTVQCPLFIGAKIDHDQSGIAWVVYSAYYDGVWHQIATDNDVSGEKGWSTNWDCSKVTDPQVSLRIAAEDNEGNKATAMGGSVLVNLAGNMVKTVDTTPPDGWITFPSDGAVVSVCPLHLSADMTDSASGVAWVKFWADYDGSWHEVGPVTAGAEGWNATWDCGAVTDQDVGLRVTAQDNAGNPFNNPVENIKITLFKGPAAQETATETPAQAETLAPDNTQTPALTPTQGLNITIPPFQTETPVPAVSQNAPAPLFSCPAAVMPLFVGFGFLAWKKRPKYSGGED